MAKPLFARSAGVLAVTLLAIFFVSLLPLLSAARTASDPSSAPGFAVNREFKGDRLPFHVAVDRSIWQTDFDSLKQSRAQSQSQSRMPHKIPFACDPAFSPVATPRLSYVYGRCMS